MWGGPRSPNNVFRFEASWLKEEECRKVVEAGWLSSGDGASFSDQLREVAVGLKEWSTNVLGDLEKRLKRQRRN